MWESGVDLGTHKLNCGPGLEGLYIVASEESSIRSCEAKKIDAAVYLGYLSRPALFIPFQMEQEESKLQNDFHGMKLWFRANLGELKLRITLERKFLLVDNFKLSGILFVLRLV